MESQESVADSVSVSSNSTSNDNIIPLEDILKEVQSKSSSGIGILSNNKSLKSIFGTVKPKAIPKIVNITPAIPQVAKIKQTAQQHLNVKQSTPQTINIKETIPHAVPAKQPMSQTVGIKQITNPATSSKQTSHQTFHIKPASVPQSSSASGSSNISAKSPHVIKVSILQGRTQVSRLVGSDKPPVKSAVASKATAHFQSRQFTSATNDTVASVSGQAPKRNEDFKTFESQSGVDNEGVVSTALSDNAEIKVVPLADHTYKQVSEDNLGTAPGKRRPRTKRPAVEPTVAATRTRRQVKPRKEVDDSKVAVRKALQPAAGGDTSHDVSSSSIVVNLGDRVIKVKKKEENKNTDGSGKPLQKTTPRKRRAKKNENDLNLEGETKPKTARKKKVIAVNDNEKNAKDDQKATKKSRKNTKDGKTKGKGTLLGKKEAAKRKATKVKGDPKEEPPAKKPAPTPVVEKPLISKEKLRQMPFYKLLSLLLRSLKKKDVEETFATPVTDSIAPEYSKIIERPMDFKTMRNKLDRGDYATLNQFKADFELICYNAMTYNNPSTFFLYFAVSQYSQITS